MKNTRKTENTFNRVSYAQLKDKRYKWVRIKSKKPMEKRDKTLMYFANGQRMRRGDLYYELDGKYYRYNSNNKKHAEYQPKSYSPKGYKSRKRWRSVFIGEDTTPRDDNAKRIHNGWVAPSLMSRVFNIETWVNRIRKCYPVATIAVENVKFDTQLMENPEISGAEYQQGTLYGYEVKEYLLEKFGRKCFYCGVRNTPLNVEHIYPKGKEGSNRIDNLTIACVPCNQEKSNKLPHELSEDMQKKVEKALKAAKKTLKDAAAVNTIRWKIVETLKATSLPIIYGTGGKTKYHRTQAGLPKTHYYDAACVAGIPNPPTMDAVLAIHAVGYGHRQNLGAFQTVQTAPGFKRPYKRVENASGFQKLDTVEIQTKKGTFIGSINSFDKTPEGRPQKLRIKTDWTGGDGRVSGNVTQLSKIQKRDGYAYQILSCLKAS